MEMLLLSRRMNGDLLKQLVLLVFYVVLTKSSPTVVARLKPVFESVLPFFFPVVDVTFSRVALPYLKITSYLKSRKTGLVNPALEYDSSTRTTHAAVDEENNFQNNRSILCFHRLRPIIVTWNEGVLHMVTLGWRNSIITDWVDSLPDPSSYAPKENIVYSINTWREGQRGDWDRYEEATGQVPAPVVQGDLLASVVRVCENFLATCRSGQQSATVQNVLLYGPPGCGKSSLVRYVACKFSLPIYVLDPDVQITEAAMRQVLYKMSRPSLVLIEDMHVATARKDVFASKRISLQFILNLLSGIHQGLRQGCIVFATTNYVDSLGKVMRRRFDMQVRLGHCDRAQARELLCRAHGESAAATCAAWLEAFSENTHIVSEVVNYLEARSPEDITPQSWSSVPCLYKDWSDTAPSNASV